MRYFLLLALALLVALALRPGPVAAQPLTFDRAVVCGTGAGYNGWGPTTVAGDPVGNTYVAGSFSGVITLGTTTLSATQTPPGYTFPTDYFVAKLDAAGQYVWAVQTADGQSVGVSALAVDGAGDVYVAGGFDSFSVRFGANGPVLFNSSALSEAFVAKLSGATGQWLWARRAGGTGYDSFRAVAVNAAGEVYALGSSGGGAADVGPVVLTGAQEFLAKLSPAGAWLWAQSVGGVRASQQFISCVGLQLDGPGNLYIGGTFSAPSIALGTTTLTTQYVAGAPLFSGGEVFVAKLSPAGAWLWATQGDAGGQQNKATASSLTYDGAGRLYLSGGYASYGARIGGIFLPNLSDQYPPPIGPAPPNPYTNNYYSDAFVARLDAGTGAWQWAVRNGGLGNESASLSTADAQGRVYAVGSFVGPTPGGSPANLAQLDGATGAWRSFQSIGPLAVRALALDAQNRPLLAGYFNAATVQLGPVTLAQAGAGRSTGCLARMGAGPLAARGAARWRAPACRPGAGRWRGRCRRAWRRASTWCAPAARPCAWCWSSRHSLACANHRAHERQTQKTVRRSRRRLVEAWLRLPPNQYCEAMAPSYAWSFVV